MSKESSVQGDTKNQLHITASFLEGMYYAGKLPSRAESYQIARYIRSHHLVDGTLMEVETLVIEAMTAMHREKGESLDAHDDL